MDRDGQGQDLVSKIALDVKALTLLYGSDSRLQNLLKKDFLESKDEDIKRFVGLLQTGRESRRRGALVVALCEMVLASFLAIAGIAAFVPDLIGLSTPQAFLNYFSGFVPASASSGPLFSALVAGEFAFAAVLVLGALYTLRQASVDLKRASLVIDTSES
jgi:hypothetical protein